MSPSIANVVVQIAAEDRAKGGHGATEVRVIERLKKLGFSESDVRSVLNDAQFLGIVSKKSDELAVVGAR